MKQSPWITQLALVLVHGVANPWIEDG